MKRNIIFLCVAVLLIAGFLVIKNISTSQDNSNSTLSESVTNFFNKKKIVQRSVPEGWKEYRSDKYHFSLLYPKELEVKEYVEGDGATTFIFQNIEKEIGFQLFVLPYFEEKVSEDRFRKDISSGVRSGLTNLSFSGAVGATFYSWDTTLLAKTWELWFIQNKLLYEVTTVKQLEPWLTPILETWQFI